MNRTIVFATLLWAGVAVAQKPVIGVAQVDVAAHNISCEGMDRAVYDCNENLAVGFRQMLETAVFKSGKVDVMERGQLDGILTEQGLAEVGLTDAGGGLGGLTGVDYLLYGAITKFGQRESGMSLGGGGNVGSLFGGKVRRGAGGVSKKTTAVDMGVDLKITDVATGKIVIADSVEGSVSPGSSLSLGGIETGGTSSDPFADVQRVVAARITELMVTRIIPIKVIQVRGDGTLILNYGNVFFRPGEQLGVFAVGEQIVDPDTGEVLGADETEVGLVEIVRAEAKYSTARLVSGDAEIAVGSTLKRAAAPAATDSGRKSKRKRSGGRIF